MTILSPETGTRPKFTRASVANPAIDAGKITELEPRRKVGTGGRPRLLPAMPSMPLSGAERTAFDEFIDEYLTQFPDLLPTDYRLLYLAATEYIKYLRITARELESGTVIAMSRQHPAVNMRALLDQLSVTRRARARSKQDDSPEGKELTEFLLELSSPTALHQAKQVSRPSSES